MPRYAVDLRIGIACFSEFRVNRLQLVTPIIPACGFSDATIRRYLKTINDFVRMTGMTSGDYCSDHLLILT